MGGLGNDWDYEKARQNNPAGLFFSAPLEAERGCPRMKADGHGF